MIDSNQTVREVYKMLGNLCIPTIHQVVKDKLNQFLNKVELVLEEKTLGYLVEILMKFDLNKLEEKHDQLNIRFIELTYGLYEVWIEYIAQEVKEDDVLKYKLHKEFIEDSSERFFSCILNQDILDFYHLLHQLDTIKERLIQTKIVSKYEDNMIHGCKKKYLTLKERIQHVFKVIKDYLINLDADLYLFEFIDDYEHYCLIVTERMNALDEVMMNCRENYLNLCCEVFGPHINRMYQYLEHHGQEVNISKLKLHLLEFIKMMFSMND